MVELFKEIKVDWLGKRKLFLVISGAIMVIGMISLIAKGGFRYGVDFKGGTVVTVRFHDKPEIDQLRKLLQDNGAPMMMLRPHWRLLPGPLELDKHVVLAEPEFLNLAVGGAIVLKQLSKLRSISGCHETLPLTTVPPLEIDTVTKPPFAINEIIPITMIAPR